MKRDAPLPSSVRRPLFGARLWRRIVGVALVLWCVTSPALAQDDVETPVMNPGAVDGSEEAATQVLEVGSISLTLPGTWRPRPISEVKLRAIAPVPAYSTVIDGGDARLRMHLLLIDPLGLDIKWPIQQLLAPTLHDLLVQSGAPESELATFHTFECKIGGKTGKGRIVNVVLKQHQRVLSGVACGLALTDRWLAFFILIDADHQRPLLLKQTMIEATEVMRSVRLGGD